MSRVVIYPVEVAFGDCDPAGIVYYPNFSRWMDAASMHFFRQCGVPSWRELERTSGIVGAPLLEIHTRFARPATYGDSLSVHTSVQEWRSKVFVHRHEIRRGDEVLCEGTETRAFCRRVPGDTYRIQAVSVPPEIRALCA